MDRAPLLPCVVGTLAPERGWEWNVLESKRILFALLGYEIKLPDAEPVKRFHDSFARHLIVVAPARTSKSYSAAVELVHAFLPVIDLRSRRPLDDERKVWAVGVNYDSSTLKEWDYVWSYLAADDFALIRGLGGRVTQKHNSPNSGNLRITAEWGPAMSGRTARTVIEGKSSSNEVSLQGEEIALAVLSEAAEHDRRVVEKYLETRCSRIIYPTTPKRKAMWLYDMAQKGAADPALSVEEIQYTVGCNPTYDMERFEAAKARAIATYGDYLESQEFCEQFLGHWSFWSGTVLPFRWHDDPPKLRSHIVSERDDRWPEIDSWLRYADWIVSLDYGYTDACVALFWAVSPDGQHVLMDEIHDRYLSNPDFVARIRAKEGELGIRPCLYVPDPQKPEVSKLLRQAGLEVFGGLTAHEHRDRASSARALVDLLSIDPKVGRPRLLVHERCSYTIREWKALRRKEATSGMEATDEWAKSQLVGEQHCFDAARYYAKACRNHRASNTYEKLLEDDMRGWQRRQAIRNARERQYRRWSGVSTQRA